MDKILENIRTELNKNSEEAVRESGKRFFREEIRTYGVKTAVVTKTAKKYFKEIENNNKDEIFSLCEELWKSGYIEESFIACSFAYFIKKDFSPGDLKIFERWINLYVSNWASCDTLCNHTVAALIEMYPDKINELKKWAASENRWMKRASAVTLIIPARHGNFLEDIFDIADILLQDADDLVQKGYGWMLKAASEASLNEVFEYVMSKKSIMPRTSLRYAIEKMPKELKKKAMEK